MDNNSLILRSENTNCAGCGMSIALNLIGDALGNKIKMVIPACCGIVTAHSFPFSAYKIPVVASTFAASSAVASGIRAIQKLNNEEGTVIAFAGDGGTFDIGMACLSGSAERNEDIIYICYDNEIYGNTGAQRSSATPFSAITTTTPIGKTGWKKDIVSIMVAHAIPYAATLSVGYPDDFIEKLKTAEKIEGFRFLHIISPCIPNWKIEPANTVKLSRLSVLTGIFPLYEVFNGTKYRITVKPEKFLPVKEYFKLQKRFSLVDDNMMKIYEDKIFQNWKRLLKLEAEGN